MNVNVILRLIEYSLP